MFLGPLSPFSKIVYDFCGFRGTTAKTRIGLIRQSAFVYGLDGIWEIEEVKKTISGLFDKLHEAEQNGQVEELKIELETVKKEKEEQISALQQTNERLQMTEHQLQVLKEENARLGEACDDADAIEQGLRDEIFELKQQLAKLQAEKDGEDTREVNRRMGNIEAAAGHSTKACEKEMRSDSPCSAVSSFEKCWFIFSPLLLA
ncbi:unnamed protein product [Gongylonema pulchrum]|uniref:Myosin_tail_1 domain-containing protein n=1 Tax=Gongylonema pulchrum TaxID=637853 RepID=A0A183E4Q4_9BILA|nr:unnamed protein product [Gongylonema pulchrum]